MNNQKVTLLSSFQSDTLSGYLKNDQQYPLLEVQNGGYDQIIPQIQNIIKNNHQFSNLLLWTLPERIFSEFSKLLNSENISENILLNEINQYLDVISMIPSNINIVHISFQPGKYTRGIGISDYTSKKGIHYFLQLMNLKLIELSKNKTNLNIVDSTLLYHYHQPESFQPKLWYLSKNPFSNLVYKRATNEIKAILRTNFGGSRKLIILDLDDTLWGGIVGDDGWKNLKLGGHDYIGESFQDFQKELLKLKNQGIILAIASKNDEKNAWEAFSKHPEMILKKEHISAYRINWEDKAKNILEILKELNLTASSAVFFDDNPVERKRIKDLIPEIEVPELTSDKTQYRSILAQMTCFDINTLTGEDLRRTEMYNEEKQRESTKGKFVSTEDWLSSLETVIEYSKLTSEDLERTHQLFNKTNQMNLTTRRMSSDELWKWANQSGNEIFTFKVSDKFGSSGLTGILGLQHKSQTTTITDFILSCRVMGRKVEESMLAIACEQAIQNKSINVHANYLQTEKNTPCYDFFKKCLNEFNSKIFTIDLSKPIKRPKEIKFKD